MRPVLLQRDDIYWRNVVSGMKLRSVDPSATRARIDMVEAAWKGFPPSYMQFMASNKDTGTEYNGSDSELACSSSVRTPSLANSRIIRAVLVTYCTPSFAKRVVA